MHVAKRGLRALGIAESFSRGDRSILAGVVMRKDLRIDGFAYTTTTVGGMDATRSILSLYEGFHRDDINLILVSGGVIAWYNIVDPSLICQVTGRPTILVTYEESEGLEGDILYHFPGDTDRLEAYRRLGSRVPLHLRTGHTIFLRGQGIGPDDAGRVCSDFTFDGKIPEPLRVARLYARSILRTGAGSGSAL